MTSVPPIGPGAVAPLRPSARAAPSFPAPVDGPAAPVEAAAPRPPDIATEVARESRQLARLVREALPEVDPRTAVALGGVENLGERLRTRSSAPVKAEMREALWALRQALEAGPEAGQSREIRECLERVRTASLDSSWQAGVPAYPSERHPPVTAIPNFREVAEGLYRGGQPTQEGVDWLLARGIGHEVDLRGDDADNQWAPPAWGPMKRCSIPMPDYGKPTMEQVEEFLRIVEDPASRPLYVHCKAGVGRTGVMIACWRVTRGWSAEEAIARERFHSYEGSFAQADFVRDFERHWRARQG